MSMNLHPPGFIETAGGCEGPRYVRSQPSRETAGVTLNECETKYNPQFKLPYRNISRYISELGQSWDKLTENDKKLVTQDLFKHVPSLKQNVTSFALSQNTSAEGALQNINNQVTSSPTVLTFLRDYVSIDPIKNTKETLDAMYYPSDTIKQAINEEKREDMRKGIYEWSSDQCISFHINPKTCLFLFIMILLFFLFGFFLGKDQKKK